MDHDLSFPLQGGSKLQAMKQQRVKLTYFNVRARAEFLRLMLAQAGVPYTDERITFQEWPALKPSEPNPFLVDKTYLD